MGTTTSPSDGMPESPKVQSLLSPDKDNNNNNNNKNFVRGGTTTALKSARVKAINGAKVQSLNDHRLSDHTDHTNSFNNSSLSSFLSVLLEDEESSEFLIVQDNPKLSEQRSIRDLRLPFSIEQKHNDKPKSRWDYLVKTGSDKDLLSSRRRNMKSSQLRSSSFSGAINSSRKPKRRNNNNNNSSSSSSSSNNKNCNSINNNINGRSNSNKFLQMPLRQESPTEDEMARKLLVDRLNQSESDLHNMHIPSSCRDRNNYNNATNYNGRRGQNSDCAELLRRSVSDRFGSNSSSRSANASWSTTKLRAKRNEFFDRMIELDGDACVVGAASSPIQNSSSS